MVPSLPQQLIDILVDPEDKGPLRPADETVLQRLREAIARGKARRADGAPPPDRFEGAFITVDGRRAYLVLDGIADFLVEHRLELDAPVDGS